MITHLALYSGYPRVELTSSIFVITHLALYSGYPRVELTSSIFVITHLALYSGYPRVELTSSIFVITHLALSKRTHCVTMAGFIEKEVNFCFKCLEICCPRSHGQHGNMLSSLAWTTREHVKWLHADVSSRQEARLSRPGKGADPGCRSNL